MVDIGLLLVIGVKIFALLSLFGVNFFAIAVTKFLFPLAAISSIDFTLDEFLFLNSSAGELGAVVAYFLGGGDGLLPP